MFGSATAISAFILLKLLSGDTCESVVINDPVKKETIAYKCFPPPKEPVVKEPVVKEPVKK